MKNSHPLIQKFQKTFNQLNKDNLHILNQVYAEDLEFKDPIHQIHGLENYKKYLGRLYQKVQYCHFDFQRTFIEGQEALMVWNMVLEHPHLNSGKRYDTQGSSWIQFGDKINYHQDFFDVSQFLFERVPLLGKIPQWIKRAI